MWKLLHVMSIYGLEKTSAFPEAVDYSCMLADFVKTHLPCGGCRTHFRQKIGELESDEPLRDPCQVRNHDDLIIWLWKLHNDVNRMLMDDQDSDKYGDLEDSPKEIWPDEDTTEEDIVAILEEEYHIY